MALSQRLTPFGQRGPKNLVRLKPRHQQRQGSRITGGEKAGIVLTEQPRITRNIAGNDRQARHASFRDHVSPTFHHRADHHGVASRVQTTNRHLCDLTQPAVTRVDLHLSLRSKSPVSGVGTPRLNNPDARRCRQQTRCLGSPQTVFFITQMTHHTHRDRSRRGPGITFWQRQCRLMNSVQNSVVSRGNVMGHMIMQPDQRAGMVQARTRNLRVAVLKTINIGTREHHNQGSIREALRKCSDTARTAPSVQGNQHIIRSIVSAPLFKHIDLMPGPTQEPRPTRSGGAVTRERARGCRCHQCDSHCQLPCRRLP